MVAGTHAHAQALRDEVAGVLAPMGLRLSDAKTRVCHIDEGWTSWVAHPAPPAARKHPTLRLHLPVQEGPGGRQGDRADVDKGHAQPAAWGPAAPAQLGAAGLDHLLPPRVLLGDLRAFTWRRVVTWLRRKHPRINWKELPGWWPTQGTVAMANPAAVAIVRYCYRGAKIPTPWTSSPEGSTR
jgi:RNA-directed DNA polymerase